MSKNNNKMSLRQGIFTQTSSILGVAIVTYPYTYAQLGYLLSTLLTIFMCILSAFTLYILTRCSKKTKLSTFDELFAFVSGNLISFCGSFIFYLGCILPLIFYLKISVDFFDSIGLFLGFKSHKFLISIVITLLNALLCIIYMDANGLEFISIVSLIALLIFIIYISNDFIASINQIDFRDLKIFDLDNRSLNGISFIIFVFISHSSILPIVECIETLERSKDVIIISNIISTIVYIIVGFFGFCVFPNSEKNYLQNKGETTKGKITLIFFLAIVNVLSFPLMMIPARRNVVSLINFFKTFTTTKRMEILNIAFNSAICLFFMILMGETCILDSMFFLVGSLIMFIIPIYLFYKIVKDISKIEKLLSMISLIVASFGIYMGVKGLIFEIVN